MDCLDARAALSALHDGESPDATCLAALEHRATCVDCDGFARALEALARIPSPPAPSELAERISATIVAEADLDERRAAALQEAPALLLAQGTPTQEAIAGFGNVANAPVNGLPPWLTRTRLWAATAGVALVAAAVVGVVVITGQGTDQIATSKLINEAIQRDATVSGAGAPSPVQPGASAPAATAAPVTTPDYIAFETFAYVAGATSEATGATLTTVGATQTALRGSTVQSVPVLRVSGSTDVILLAIPGGGRQSFALVTRQLSGRRYRLAAGPSLDRFGIWPTLPSGWNAPTGADGSPYYRAAGTDGLGVRVFVRIGQTPESGFLVAPGTLATDPAAGNPGWTLWLPTQ